MLIVRWVLLVIIMRGSVKRKHGLFIKTMIGLVLISLLLSGVFPNNSKDNQKISSLNIIHDSHEDLLLEANEELSNINPTRGNDGGELEWSIKLASNDNEAMLSTPALCDLNPPENGYGRKYLETVVACTDDHVYAVNHDGTPRWTYSDCVIDDAITGTSRMNLDFSPPPLFSSVTPVDIGGGNTPELLIGEQDGVLAIAADGTTHWVDKGKTDRFYYSDVIICDLEGDYGGIDPEGNDVGYKDDLEIIWSLCKDRYNSTRIYSNFYNQLSIYDVNCKENEFLLSHIVAAELDGWFFRDGQVPEHVKKTNPETLYSDLIVSTPYSAGRIWKHNKDEPPNIYHEKANISGYETYSTVTVGNFSCSRELECIVGTGSGLSSWETSIGTVLSFRQDGNLVCNPFFTGPAPSAVFSSPASCDAQNLKEKDLPEGQVIDYEVYFGCDNGIFYCLNANDLTELWHYQTDGRILSSPAICNINSDDSLEVIVGSNDGKVYCFEGDPQELDLDGKAHPKDDGICDAGGAVGSYDVLWIFDTNTVEGSSGEIGISSPVVGDIDYDGQLEVLIGDTKGTLYCINAGGTCIPGQVDWHKIHFDLNNTGFYKPPPFYGVKVEPKRFPTPEPQFESLKKSVKPGGTVTYNLTITNIGNLRINLETDRYWIQTTSFMYTKCGNIQDRKWPDFKLTDEDLKWSGGSAGKGKPYVELESFQETDITLTITAPWTCDIDEYFIVELEANSSRDPWARDSVRITTVLEIILDFEVDILKEPIRDKESDLYGRKMIKVNPGGQATIPVAIRNKGTLNDTYDLRIFEVISGWEANFEESGDLFYPNIIQLDAPIMAEPFKSSYVGSEYIVNFNVTAPVDAQMHEIFTIKIVATSRYSQNPCLAAYINRYDFILVGIDPIINFELECKKPLQYVNPYGYIIFEIDVINHGETGILVNIEHNQLEPDWDLELYNNFGMPLYYYNNSIEVRSNNITKISAVVHASELALAESKKLITINGTMIKEGEITQQIMQSINLIVIVNQLFDINVNIDPLILFAAPDDVIVYNITIENKGNGDDFVEISPVLPALNWRSTLYLDGQEQLKSELKYNESLTFQMQIYIPHDQLMGTYENRINVSSKGDYEVVYFRTTINKIYDASIFGRVHSQVTGERLLVSTIKPEPGVAPGSMMNYIFEVTNHGNAPDEIEIKIESIVKSWDNWEGFFVSVMNTNLHIENIKRIDFSDTIDFSNEVNPIGYLNKNFNTELHNISLKLGVGQKVWIKMQLLLSPKITINDVDKIRTFMVWVDSKAPNGTMKDKNFCDNVVFLKLKILFPDLIVMDKLYHSNNIKAGNLITIGAVIKNIGDIEAHEVLITFYVDDSEVKTQKINLLEKGKSRLVTFNWEAITGEHEFTIRVDPANTVMEKFEDNNEISKTVKVNPEVSINILLYLILILIIIFLLVLLKINKKRKFFFINKQGN